MSRGGTIHLYCLSWNDKRTLPFFFRYYNEIVDHFYVFDNGSTDGFLELLAAADRVQVTHFERDPRSFVEQHRRLSEVIWKNSKELADWVILVDIDEHTFHEDLRGYLANCKREGVTAIAPLGYEMVSDTFPITEGRLCDVVTAGVPSHWLEKLCIFDPMAIEKLNYSPGRHLSAPEGRVVWPKQREVLLLHYKKLGLSYVIERSAELSTGLRPHDIEMDWGMHYFYSPEQIMQDFERVKARARPVPRLPGTRADRQALGEDNSEGNHELQELTHKVAIRDGEIYRLNQQLALQETEAGQLGENLEVLASEFERARGALAARERELENLSSGKCSLSADIDRLRSHADALIERNSLLLDQLSQRDAELQSLRSDVEAFKCSLNAVYHSTSWRITRPLRLARWTVERFLKRVPSSWVLRVFPKAKAATDPRRTPKPTG